MARFSAPRLLLSSVALIGMALVRALVAAVSVGSLDTSLDLQGALVDLTPAPFFSVVLALLSECLEDAPACAKFSGAALAVLTTITQLGGLEDSLGDAKGSGAVMAVLTTITLPWACRCRLAWKALGDHRLFART